MTLAKAPPRQTVMYVLMLALLFFVLPASANYYLRPTLTRFPDQNTTAIFAGFARGSATKTIDPRAALFSVTTGGKKETCSSVYFMGLSSRGENELVGYKLSVSGTNSQYDEAVEPLDEGLQLAAAPSPFAILICETFQAIQGFPLMLSTQVSSGGPVTAYVGEAPHHWNVCLRAMMHIGVEHAQTLDAAAITSAASNAVNRVFARYSLIDDNATFFSLAPKPEISIFRTCIRQGVSISTLGTEALAASMLLSNPSFLVSAVAIPAIQELELVVGPVTDDAYMGSSNMAQPLDDIDWKCMSRTGSPRVRPSRSRCVYERCTNPPVLASSPSCYFGDYIITPDAECAMRGEFVPPPQRDCTHIGVVDVGINSIDSSGSISFGVQIYFDQQTDVNQDDFPLVSIEVDNFRGIEAQTCASTGYMGHEELGDGLRYLSVPCSGHVTQTGTSTVIDVSGNTTHMIQVQYQRTEEEVDAYSSATIITAGIRVYLRRTGATLYSSKSTPKLNGVIETNVETGTRSVILDGFGPTPWQSQNGGLFYGYVMFHGPSLKDDDIICNAAFATETGNALVPTQWVRSAIRQISQEEHISLFSFSPAYADAVRCNVANGTVITGVTSMYQTEGTLGFNVRSVDLNSPLPVPRGHVGQIQFSLGGSDKSPGQIADDLAKALSYEGTMPTVAKLLNEGSSSSSGIFTAVFRIPPLTSFLLPTAETLERKFAAVTGGAQLVLPGGATSAADVSRTALYSAVEEGVWQCGRDGNFGACELPAPNCGDSFATPLHCVQSESGIALDPVTDPSAAVACAFDEQVLPTLPQSAGCGSFSCRAPDGTVVPCNDARICISGCAVNTKIDGDLVANNSEFHPVCVKDGVVQDESYCPSTLVSPASYAPTCNATSSCGTVCFAESTGKRVECTDTASWSECLDACNGGLSTHFARCADTTVPVGDDAATEVPVSLCPGGVLNVELSTACPVDLSTCPGPMVTVETTSVEGEYTITWDDANGKVDVTAQDNALVQLFPVEGSAAIVLGTVNATDFEFSFDVIAQNLLPGQYVAVVTLDGVLRGESAPFTILACSPACVNGKCNSISGQCVCDAGFTGEDCSISPCDVKQCNADTTEECSADTGVAICKCRGAWSGERCEVSPCSKCSEENGSCVVTDENTANCKCFTDHDGSPLFYGSNCDIPSNYCETHAPPCAHDGTRAGEFLDGAFMCTDCACTQNWDSATDCKTCGLPCAHGSAPDNECAFCKCPIMGGYSGPLCECRNAYMSFIVRDKDVDFDAVASAFERTHEDAAGTSPVDQLSLLFATELASVTKIRVVNPAAAVKPLTSPSGVRYYEVVLSVGPQCTGTVPVSDERMIPTYEAINDLKQFMSAGSHTTNGLVALSATHTASGFGANDPNCKLPGDQCPTGWTGNGKYIEADGTQDCSGAGASDPQCSGSTTEPDNDGLSTGAIVGIAVGGSVALILILLVVLWVAGIGCFAAAKASSGSAASSVASV